MPQHNVETFDDIADPNTVSTQRAIDGHRNGSTKKTRESKKIGVISVFALFAVVLVICIYAGSREIHSSCRLTAKQPVAVNAMVPLASGDGRALVNVSGYIRVDTLFWAKPAYQDLDLRGIIHTDLRNESRKIELVFNCATLAFVLADNSESNQFVLIGASLFSQRATGKIQLATNMRAIKFDRDRYFICDSALLFYRRSHIDDEILVLSYLAIEIDGNKKNTERGIFSRHQQRC